MGLPGNGGFVGEGDSRDPRAREGYHGDPSPFGGIAGGAAYYTVKTNPYFINCIFTDNRAYEAYAEDLDSGIGYYSRRVFVEGTPYYTWAGGLYVEPNSTVTVYNSEFTGNLGGAVFI
jgi:hypothetical protein